MPPHPVPCLWMSVWRLSVTALEKTKQCTNEYTLSNNTRMPRRANTSWVRLQAVSHVCVWILFCYLPLFSGCSSISPVSLPSPCLHLPLLSLLSSSFSSPFLLFLIPFPLLPHSLSSYSSLPILFCLIPFPPFLLLSLS